MKEAEYVIEKYTVSGVWIPLSKSRGCSKSMCMALMDLWRGDDSKVKLRLVQVTMKKEREVVG